MKTPTQGDEAWAPICHICGVPRNKPGKPFCSASHNYEMPRPTEQQGEQVGGESPDQRVRTIIKLQTEILQYSHKLTVAERELAEARSLIECYKVQEEGNISIKAELRAQLQAVQGRLAHYQAFTNKVDDYFEYHNESKKDRERVHKYLAELTALLTPPPQADHKGGEST